MPGNPAAQCAEEHEGIFFRTTGPLLSRAVEFVSAWLIIARFQFQGFSSPGRGSGAKAKMW